MLTRTYVLIVIVVLVVLLLAMFACGRGGSKNSGGVLTALPTGSGGDSATLDQARSELDDYDAPDGVDPSLFKTLSDRFLEELAKAQAKGASQAGEPESWNMELNAVDNTDGTYTFQWRYFLPGDYDLGGEVGVPDITPIAQNYLADATDGENDRFESFIDGDESGEIGVPDITTIAQNYLATYDVVFAVFDAAPDPAWTAADWETNAIYFARGNARGTSQVGNIVDIVVETDPAVVPPENFGVCAATITPGIGIPLGSYLGIMHDSATPVFKATDVAFAIPDPPVISEIWPPESYGSQRLRSVQ